jgi:hypothetical protein
MLEFGTTCRVVRDPDADQLMLWSRPLVTERRA